MVILMGLNSETNSTGIQVKFRDTMVGRSTWEVLQLVKGLIKPIAELKTSNWRVTFFSYS